MEVNILAIDPGTQTGYAFYSFNTKKYYHFTAIPTTTIETKFNSINQAITLHFYGSFNLDHFIPPEHKLNLFPSFNEISKIEGINKAFNVIFDHCKTHTNSLPNFVVVEDIYAYMDKITAFTSLHTYIIGLEEFLYKNYPTISLVRYPTKRMKSIFKNLYDNNLIPIELSKFKLDKETSHTILEELIKLQYIPIPYTNFNTLDEHTKDAILIGYAFILDKLLVI